MMGPITKSGSMRARARKVRLGALFSPDLPAILQMFLANGRFDRSRYPPRR